MLVVQTYWLKFAFKFIHCSRSYAGKQKECFVNALYIFVIKQTDMIIIV